MAPENGKRIILQIEWSVVSKIRDLNSILALISPVLTLTPQTAPDIYSDIYHLICQILSEYEEDSFLSEAVIYARMLDILSLIGRYQAFASCRFDAGPQKQKEYLDRFLSICNYIDEHCTEDLSLDQVAKTAGFSKYHFTRLFKQFTNTTYYKYLNRKRIDHAMLLLSDPDIPVTEAALQSGFSSLSTFLRVFRSVKQCTPTEFRDMYIHPEKAAEKSLIPAAAGKPCKVCMVFAFHSIRRSIHADGTSDKTTCLFCCVRKKTDFLCRTFPAIF